MQCGQLMIHPRAGETDRQHERRLDTDQGLFEIGAVLLGDMVKLVAIEPRAGFHIEAVEIADHRLRPMPGLEDDRGTAIGRRDPRRKPGSKAKIVRARRAAAEEAMEQIVAGAEEASTAAQVSMKAVTEMSDVLNTTREFADTPVNKTAAL